MTEHDSGEVLDEEREHDGRLGRLLKTVIVAAVIVVLAMVVLFLLAERNSRRYFLVVEGGHLLVQRGIFFPVGERSFTPDDADFAAAYHPIPIPAGSDAAPRQSFNERTELDRVLVDQLLTWSRERIDPEQPDRLEQGIYYLRRAERLPTTTSAQRDEMEMLRGEVAYHEGRRFIESALRNLDTARERLTQARDSPAGWGRESRNLLRAIREPEASLRRALREGERVVPESADEPGDEPGRTQQESGAIDTESGLRQMERPATSLEDDAPPMKESKDGERQLEPDPPAPSELEPRGSGANLEPTRSVPGATGDRLFSSEEETGTLEPLERRSEQRRLRDRHGYDETDDSSRTVDY